MCRLVPVEAPAAAQELHFPELLVRQASRESVWAAGSTFCPVALP
jgi:hypothetical protein